jgi:ADP-ribose pyrophosphatase YjhB (NUDIX family)
MNRDYPDRPFVGVGTVVWRGDKVLLVRRSRAPRLGEWGLPGGAQELGETIFDAAIREVHEETGLTVQPVGIITAIDLIDRQEPGFIRFHYSIVEVAARYVSGELQAGDDVSEAQWVDPADVPTIVEWSEVSRVVGLSKALL